MTSTDTEQKTQVVTQQDAPPSNMGHVFSNMQSFADAQRMVKAICSSNMVPEQYRGDNGTGNALIALEMAQRIDASPMAVMQNLHVVNGKPSWSSQFIIAALNSCGLFSPLRFADDGQSCYAWAYDKETGDKLEGPPVTMEMAKAEGWLTRSGSKWKNMPDLMRRYRAAAFFGRLYAPHILVGMHTADEVEDIAAPGAPVDVTPTPTDDSDLISALNDEITGGSDKPPKKTTKKAAKKSSKKTPPQTVEGQATVVKEDGPPPPETGDPGAEPDDGLIID